MATGNVMAPKRKWHFTQWKYLCKCNGDKWAQARRMRYALPITSGKFQFHYFPPVFYLICPAFSLNFRWSCTNCLTQWICSWLGHENDMQNALQELKKIACCLRWTLRTNLCGGEGWGRGCVGVAGLPQWMDNNSNELLVQGRAEGVGGQERGRAEDCCLTASELFAFRDSLGDATELSVQ